jgi:formylglycine-generating enzyme required for sulfatase activity
MKALLLAGVLLGGLSAPTREAVVARRPLETMLSLSGGSFTLGASDAMVREARAQCMRILRAPLQQQWCDFASEGPEREVQLPAFALDRTEVTVAAYRACVRDGACSPEPLFVPDARFSAPELPVSWVNWDDAARYCHWRGARLPTEAEWERAARGQDRRVYPWGNLPLERASNHGRLRVVQELGPRPSTMIEGDDADGYTFVAPVGSFRRGVSPEGIHDLAGNLMEWTVDAGGALEGAGLRPAHGGSAQTGDLRVVRGGSWRQPLLYQRATSREVVPAETRSVEIGFRCAADFPPGPRRVK